MNVVNIQNATRADRIAVSNRMLTLRALAVNSFQETNFKRFLVKTERNG